jgi:hypothetical protein
VVARRYWIKVLKHAVRAWPPIALNVCWHVLGYVRCRSSTAAALYSETKMCMCTKIEVMPRAS